MAIKALQYSNYFFANKIILFFFLIASSLQSYNSKDLSFSLHTFWLVATLLCTNILLCLFSQIFKKLKN